MTQPLAAAKGEPQTCSKPAVSTSDKQLPITTAMPSLLEVASRLPGISNVVRNLTDPLALMLPLSSDTKETARRSKATMVSHSQPY